MAAKHQVILVTVEEGAMSSAPKKRAEAEPDDHSAQDTSRPRRMLSQEQVLAIVPISPTTLWRMEGKGQFPRGTFISANKKIWFEDEVRQWQDQVNGRGRGRRHHPPAPKS